MKRYKIKTHISDFKLDLFTYIEAKVVLQVSHERVVADGVTIDLPGNIISVEVIS